jgi:hypothetical protein
MVGRVWGVIFASPFIGAPTGLDLMERLRLRALPRIGDGPDGKCLGSMTWRKICFACKSQLRIGRESGQGLFQPTNYSTLLNFLLD